MQMSTHIEGKMSNGSWNEERYAQLENGGGLSQASVTQTVEGDIEGEGSVEWLMCYRPDKTAEFVGLQRIVGSVDGRAGSFVLQSTGVFDGKEARGSLSVVPGSGTGDLGGVTGTGEFSAPHGPEAAYSLDLDFE
jgi:Protein of unknown function (DUF3224)